MNAQEELNPEDRDESLAATNEAAEAATNPDATPARAAETRGAPPVEHDAGAGAPKMGPPRLNLIPYLTAAPEAAAEAKPAGRRSTSVARWASGLAACLALVAAVTAVGLYDHARQSNILAAKAAETASLAQTVKSLKERIAAVETARSHDESADSRKLAVEMKAARDATRDLNGMVAQLTARIDRLDHDQTARIDKVGERGDHEAAARIAELATRVEKLEKRPPVATVAAVAPAPPTPAPKPGVASPPSPKTDMLVSNETTGSIEKPKPMLRSYRLIDVEGAYALVDGRDGPRQVGPGDFLPGAGRVLRVERRDRDWVLVTSVGVIAGD
jgi:hypothetical protein